MAELFLELLSEEIPAKLQTDARDKIKHAINEKLNKKEIIFKSSKSFSTPKRLVFIIDGIPTKIEKKKKIIRGPKVDAPKAALDGFIKSNNLKISNVYKKKIEKGEFYFSESKSETQDVLELLQLILPEVLQNYSWKKSMKWSTNELNWGRPLKSILALFNNKVIHFNFFHLKTNNLTFIDGLKHEVAKKVVNFKSYLSILKSQNIILNQDERKEMIMKKMEKICITKGFEKKFNHKLIEEVVNLVEKPHVILCKFDEIYLKIPKEILIVNMQHHQKYFPLFDNNQKLTNSFLLVANLSDKKGYIKTGNQKVIEARFSDAKFFWEKNKNQNLVKQISKLKSLVFYNDLGNFFDRTQRLRKLASIISGQMNLSKEKVEIASSICKADLISDLVGEYPELQGVMGKYFAKEQGFADDISLAISDHYLPTGANSLVAKKPISQAVAIIDKVDLLVGFFGINQKPSSSKDPFALRRTAIGLLRTITENKLKIELKELINYSIRTYEEQNVKLSNKLIFKDVIFFLKERFKNYLKDKKIRSDIIEAVIASHTSDDFLTLNEKCQIINKNINKDVCKDIINSYKRVSNIVDQEQTDKEENNYINPELLLFKKEEEKSLFDKINEIRKYFSSTRNNEKYDLTLKILADAKPAADNFFDNVIVNDENLDIKKNRIALLKMFCKTYDNFIDFSKVEGG
tara:strand:- start:2407 stop:4473 length:2067 start_codon:yes stop_codon:yes gene_type:complete